MKMRILEILRGIPASGKSTYAISKAESDPDTVRVNRDDIRKMLGYSFSQFDSSIENIITDATETMIKSFLKRDYNVIVDNLNLRQVYVNNLHELAREIGNVKVIEKHFNADLENALMWNSARDEKVPENVIKDLYERFRHLKLSDPIVYPPAQPQQLTWDYNLPNCIICDIDGTVALFNDKNPYDRDFENDVPNKPIIEHLIHNYIYINDGTNIIFVSGRSDKYKDVTHQWLMDYVAVPDKLYMRKDGDNRKDSIVKQEIYDKHIRNKYNVKLVIDDRNQVVNMWRSNGLTCLQVADGNF